MFSPGETVTQVFTIPFNANDIKYVIVSYKKNDDIVLEKKIDDHFETHAEDSVSFTVDLTQAETLLFSDCGYYTMQVNVYSTDGSRNASKEIRARNGIQYLKEVITDE